MREVLTAPSPPDPGPSKGPPGGRQERAGEQRGALLRLLLILGIGVVVAVVFGVLPTVGVMAAIVVMIMLHELGHFATAKWAGMKVTEYFLGFGPRLWSVRRGETEYGIKAVPAGGYVRILGMNNIEEVDPAEEARTYRASTFPRRLMVVSAGSFMHFVIALILLWVLLAVVGAPNADTTTVGSLTRFPHGPTPAQAGGLRLGDRILSVGGSPVASFDQLRRDVQAHADRNLALVVDRGGRRLDLVVTPINLVTDRISGVQVAVPKGARSDGFIGVGPAVVDQRVDPLTAAGRAGSEFGGVVTSVFTAFREVFSSQGLSAYTSQITGHVTPSQAANQPRFSSVVGIVYLAHDAASSGWADVLGLLIELNVFIGIFNLAPLLPLDGGQVLVAVYERLRSRRGRTFHTDIRRWLPVTYVVMAALMVLAAASLWTDIFHPPANPFN